MSNIQEVFGQFVVELADGPKMFAVKADAVAAEAEFLKGAEFRKEASDFCAHAGVVGKPAKGRSNVITAYLAWVEAGRPEPVAEDEAEDDAEDTAPVTTETTDTVEEESEEDSTEF